MESVSFDDNINSCIEQLRSGKFREATNAIYPISKKTARFGYASDEDIAQFAKQINEVVVVLAEKAEEHEKMDQVRRDGESLRFMITDTFRILRNSCSVAQKLQSHLVVGTLGPRLMEAIRTIADTVIRQFEGEGMVQVLAVIIQFLCNLGSGMETNQDLVWDHFKGKLRLWLEMAKDLEGMDQERAVKILNFSCGVVETCLPRQWQRMERLLDDFESFNTLVASISATSRFSFDFAKKVTQKIVAVPNLAERVFNKLTTMEKYQILFGLLLVVNEWREKGEQGPMPTIDTNLAFLAKTLMVARPHLRAAALKPMLASHAEEMHLHVKMLEVLSVASSCQVFSKKLSEVELKNERTPTSPTSLIEYAIGFLHDIHTEGQMDQNMLTMSRDKNSVMCEHPGYLLRRDLVRLIGNLAFDNKDVQDFVREYQSQRGLPLIMDQMVIDERNPFLAEWAKLALGNLLRGNDESVRFLSTMQGNTKDVASLLRSAGFVVEGDSKNFKICQASDQQACPSTYAEKDVPRPW